LSAYAIWKELGKPPWWDLWNEPPPPRARGKEGFEPGILLYVGIAIVGVVLVAKGFDRSDAPPPPSLKAMVAAETAARLPLTATPSPTATPTATLEALEVHSAPVSVPSCTVFLNNPADEPYLLEYEKMYPGCELIATWLLE